MALFWLRFGFVFWTFVDPKRLLGFVLLFLGGSLFSPWTAQAKPFAFRSYTISHEWQVLSPEFRVLSCAWLAIAL
jgi:hypothetical protein